MSRLLGQHGGGTGCILSDKNLSENKDEAVDLTPMKHLITKKAKPGLLKVFSAPKRPSVGVSQSFISSLRKLSIKQELYFDPWV